METSNEGEGGREIEVSGGDFRFYMEQLLFLFVRSSAANNSKV